MTTIGEKVRHVITAKQTRDHACHWPGCKRQVRPAMWGCKEHWYKLPADLRAEIWEAYRVGQEINGTPSAKYVEVARRTQEWIKEHGR